MDNLASRYKTVYRKAVIYFRADINCTTNEELEDKISDFERNVCLDLDNAHGGYFDYEFRYDGLTAVDEDDIPDCSFNY